MNQSRTPDAVETTRRPPAIAMSHLGRTAVVIDDESMVLRGLTLVLEQLGWNVLPAESADEALSLIDQEASPPAVVIADYRLRGGHTGVEAIQAVHGALGVAIPAFLLTGDTSPDRLRDASNSGYTILHKPITFRELNNHLLSVVPA